MLATPYDLVVFFREVGKPPDKVTSADVLAFIRPRRPPPDHPTRSQTVNNVTGYYS